MFLNSLDWFYLLKDHGISSVRRSPNLPALQFTTLLPIPSSPGAVTARYCEVLSTQLLRTLKTCLHTAEKPTTSEKLPPRKGRVTPASSPGCSPTLFSCRLAVAIFHVSTECYRQYQAQTYIISTANGRSVFSTQIARTS